MNPLAIFGISAFLSLVSSAVVARLFVWPQLQNLERNRALAWLVTPHMFLRFIGLSLLVPGVVSPLLPPAFAISTAYGDLVAGLLAVVAAIGLAKRTSWAITSVWLFNLVGAADFLFAFYQGPHLGLQPGMLGAAFFVITAVVPPLSVTHVLIFGLLAHRKSATNLERSPQLRQVEVTNQPVR